MYLKGALQGALCKTALKFCRGVQDTRTFDHTCVLSIPGEMRISEPRRCTSSQCTRRLIPLRNATCNQIRTMSPSTRLVHARPLSPLSSGVALCRQRSYLILISPPRSKEGGIFSSARGQEREKERERERERERTRDRDRERDRSEGREKERRKEIENERRGKKKERGTHAERLKKGHLPRAALGHRRARSRGRRKPRLTHGRGRKKQLKEPYTKELSGRYVRFAMNIKQISVLHIEIRSRFGACFGPGMDI